MSSIKTYRDEFYIFRQNWKHRIREYFYGPCYILLYHRVTKLPCDPQLLTVSPENFYEQIKYLKQNYALLDIAEFLHLRKNKKRLPRNAVILTFDDGYTDNYHEALPILESLKAQGLFYISTSLIGTNKEYWWDELEKVFLLENQTLPELLSLKIDGRVFEFSLNERNAYMETYNKLHPIIKKLKPSAIEETIGYLLDWSGADKIARTTHRVMTKGEILQMYKSPSAIIGAHTHCHPQLSALSYQEQELEITTSKRILEEIVDDKINHFAYPYGSYNDYNLDSITICKKSGFEMVSSNFAQLVNEKADDFQLPRFLVRNWTLDVFKQNIKTFSSLNQ